MPICRTHCSCKPRSRIYIIRVPERFIGGKCTQRRKFRPQTEREGGKEKGERGKREKQIERGREGEREWRESGERVAAASVLVFESRLLLLRCFL